MNGACSPEPAEAGDGGHLFRRAIVDSGCGRCECGRRCQHGPCHAPPCGVPAGHCAVTRALAALPGRCGLRVPEGITMALRIVMDSPGVRFAGLTPGWIPRGAD